MSLDAEGLTAKKFLENKGFTDSDYMDSGMINHISELMEEYHEAKLSMPVVKNKYCVVCGKICKDTSFGFTLCDEHIESGFAVDKPLTPDNYVYYKNRLLTIEEYKKIKYKELTQ